MRNVVVREAVIVAVETALVLTIVATFGVPGGKRTNAEAVSDPASAGAPSAFDDFPRFGRSPPD